MRRGQATAGGAFHRAVTTAPERARTVGEIVDRLLAPRMDDVKRAVARHRAYRDWFPVVVHGVRYGGVRWLPMRAGLDEATRPEEVDEVSHGRHLRVVEVVRGDERGSSVAASRRSLPGTRGPRERPSAARAAAEGPAAARALPRRCHRRGGGPRRARGDRGDASGKAPRGAGGGGLRRGAHEGAHRDRARR